MSSSKEYTSFRISSVRKGEKELEEYVHCRIWTKITHKTAFICYDISEYNYIETNFSCSWWANSSVTQQYLFQSKTLTWGAWHSYHSFQKQMSFNVSKLFARNVVIQQTEQHTRSKYCCLLNRPLHLRQPFNSSLNEQQTCKWPSYITWYIIAHAW